MNSADTVAMKDDAAAKVVAVPFKTSRLVIKQYNPKSWQKAISRSVRKSKAKKSWDNAHYLSLVGCKTVNPVALIQDRIGFFVVRSFFVCEYIPGLEADKYFNAPDKKADELYATAKKVVESLLAFHLCGISIRDTRDTNFLITSQNVYWVDLDAVQVPKLQIIAKRQRIKDWQIFFYSWRHNERVLRIFWDLVHRRLGDQFCHKLRRAVATYYGKKFSLSSCSGNPDKGFPYAQEIVKEVEAIVNSGMLPPGWKKVQSARTAVVARRQTPEGGVYCKVFLPRDRREGLKRLVRLGRGARAVKNEKMLYGAGFRVQEHLFWGRQGSRDYIVSREIKGVKMVSWLEGKGGAPKRRREILKHLGEEVGKLHRTGFVHGDLRLSNILIREDAEKPVFYFLDNERTHLHRRRIPRREIVKNLRQINTDAVSRLSRTDRLRIFQAYHAACGTRYTNTQIRRLLAEVEKRTAQRLAAD
ncbi:lipopolysaccharide kinase InaA family protein [Desulfovermiculus halophilus]|uniref:lipopolysaccharide kinase InaA family protein n=1 Tax=Desulfovermiculus halophilus TaxID=339722 RepID=UPI001ABF47B4|nr:lipopolysaccharide kinase InaA family protein [Desulfovermiculus halophilus]